MATNQTLHPKATARYRSRSRRTSPRQQLARAVGRVTEDFAAGFLVGGVVEVELLAGPYELVGVLDELGDEPLGTRRAPRVLEA